MQLTLINLFKNTVPGHIFRGKRRLVREIKFRHLKKKIDDFQLQERNMHLLANPYLTAVSIRLIYHIKEFTVITIILNCRNNRQVTLKNWAKMQQS